MMMGRDGWREIIGEYWDVIYILDHSIMISLEPQTPIINLNLGSIVFHTDPGPSGAWHLHACDPDKLTGINGMSVVELRLLPPSSKDGFTKFQLDKTGSTTLEGQGKSGR